MPGRTVWMAAALVAATWPLAASAYRPFNSTDAAVAGRGELELELGPVGYLVQAPGRSLVAPSVVLNWGFAERWEAVLEGRHLIQLGATIEEPRLRVEDAALSVKRVLRPGSLQGRSGASVATELGALLPTVSGAHAVGAEWAVIVSRRWPALTAHLSAAAAWTRARAPGAFVGAILEGHDAWRVRPVAEVFVEAERGSAPTRSGLVGAIWRLREGLSLDVAARRAREGRVGTTELRVGFTWAFAIGSAG